MEYIDPEWDTLDELREIIKAEYDLGDRFPVHVSRALNIIYHNKIRRYGGIDSDYDSDVVAVAFGKRDKVKQNAVYIDLDKSCRVKNAPMDVTREEAQLEYERARRYASIVRRLMCPDPHDGIQLQKLKEATKLVFWQEYESLCTD